MAVHADNWRCLGFSNLESGTCVAAQEVNKVWRNPTAGVPERVFLVSDGMLEVQTLIKSRTRSIAGFIEPYFSIHYLTIPSMPYSQLLKEYKFVDVIALLFM